MVEAGRERVERTLWTLMGKEEQRERRDRQRVRVGERKTRARRGAQRIKEREEGRKNCADLVANA